MPLVEDSRKHILTHLCVENSVVIAGGSFIKNKASLGTPKLCDNQAMRSVTPNESLMDCAWGSKRNAEVGQNLQHVTHSGSKQFVSTAVTRLANSVLSRHCGVGLLNIAVRSDLVRSSEFDNVRKSSPFFQVFFLNATVHYVLDRKNTSLPPNNSTLGTG